MVFSVSNNINHFETRNVPSLKGIVDYALKMNFSPAVFSDGYRCLDSFDRTEMVGLDIDNDANLILKGKCSYMSIDEAREAFKEYKHIIMPSRSHQKEKHGVIADRFRVILFLSEPITDIETFYSTWFYLKSKWKAIDDQCKNPDRFYFKHSSVFSMQEQGKLIDPVVPAPQIQSG